MRRFAVLLSLAAAVSCGGDSSTTPSASVSGSYALQTVNTKPLPWLAAQNGTDKWEVVSDTITLSDSGTYTESIANRYTRNGQVTIDMVNDSGTYTLGGSVITFFSADSYTESGVVGGGTLVIKAVGIVGPVDAIYHR
jgi:hypothetical protein